MSWIHINQDELLTFNCLKCSKSHKKHLNKYLIKRFGKTYEFCDGDNKFCLLLRKGVYPYEYMGSWKRFDETLPKKEDFYSNLIIEDITDAGHKHAKNVWKNCEIKNLGQYHDLYVQSDTFLLADVFENFKNKYIEIHELDHAYFLSAPGLAWQACLKKLK